MSNFNADNNLQIYTVKYEDHVEKIKSTDIATRISLLMPQGFVASYYHDQ